MQNVMRGCRGGKDIYKPQMTPSHLGTSWEHTYLMVRHLVVQTHEACPPERLKALGQTWFDMLLGSFEILRIQARSSLTRQTRQALVAPSAAGPYQSENT